MRRRSRSRRRRCWRNRRTTQRDSRSSRTRVLDRGGARLNHRLLIQGRKAKGKRES